MLDPFIELSKEELDSIMGCSTLDVFYRDFYNQKYSRFVAAVKSCFNKVELGERYNSRRALGGAIGVASLSIDIFWIVISYTAIKSSTAARFGIGMGVLALLLAVGFYLYFNKKYHRKEQQESKELYLAMLKYWVAAEGSTRLYGTQEIIKLESCETAETSSEVPETLVTIFESFVVLFGTYHWGISDSLDMLGYKAASQSLTTLPVILAALVLSIVISLGFGYMTYQDVKNSELVEADKTAYMQGYAAILRRGFFVSRVVENPPVKEPTVDSQARDDFGCVIS